MTSDGVTGVNNEFKWVEFDWGPSNFPVQVRQLLTRLREVVGAARYLWAIDD